MLGEHLSVHSFSLAVSLSYSVSLLLPHSTETDTEAPPSLLWLQPMIACTDTRLPTSPTFPLLLSFFWANVSNNHLKI